MVDTREHRGDRLDKRIEAIGWENRRTALFVGDYTAECHLQDGSILSLADKACIERKANLEELCLSLTRERRRFFNEIIRANSTGIRMYLLVENASWERIISGDYNSKTTPESLLGSLTLLMTRYGVQVILCEETATPLLIKKILERELREAVEPDISAERR